MSPTWTRRGRHIHGSQDASALLCQDYDQSGHRGDDHQQFQIALWFVCNILQLGLLSFLFLILMHPDNQENISWKIPSIQSSTELDPDVLAAQYDRYEVRLLDPLRYNMLQQLCLNHKAPIISAVASEIEHVLETAGATLVATAGTSDSETQIRSRAPRLKGGNETC